MLQISLKNNLLILIFKFLNFMCFKLYIGWEPGWNRKQKEQKWSLCIIQIISSPGTRAVDPDPHLLYYADPDSGGENFRKKN